MPEAVIVAAARSPIGRANKGSLATMRPDDLASQVVQAVLDGRTTHRSRSVQPARLSPTQRL
jgi:acetyl-CoA acetyltransferase